MPSVIFWIGYGVLSILTVLAAAKGRNVFLLALVNTLLAVLWWAADASGYRIPSKSDFLLMGWGILLLPFAFFASVISTGIGRVVYSRRISRHQQKQPELTSQIQDSGVSTDQRSSLQLQGRIGVGIAIVLALGQIILGLKDQDSTVYYYADHLLGGALFGFGCMQYARSKFRSYWWALMGPLWALGGLMRLLALVFFCLLVGLADQPKSALAKSRLT